MNTVVKSSTLSPTEGAKPPHEVAVALDPAAIERHVRMLHHLAERSGEKGLLTVAGFGEDPATGRALQPLFRHFAVGEVEETISAIVEMSRDDHRNVYMPYTLVRADLPLGSRGKKGDLQAVLALVADLDADTGKVGALPFEAPYVIETSPGNAQAVFPLAPALSGEAATPLAHAMVQASGCDSRSKDVSGVWRVPGTLNWPNAKKLGRGRPVAPFPVAVTRDWNGRTYSKEELVWAEIAPAVVAHVDVVAVRASTPSTAPRSSEGSSEANHLLQRCGAALQVLIRRTPEAGEDRSEVAFSVLRQLVFAGFTDHEITILIESFPEGIGQRYAEGSDLAADIRRARTRLRREPAGSSHATSARPQPLPRNMSDILAMPFPPVKWVVPDFLTEGLSILAGRQKLGKTWLALDHAIAVATGGYAMGSYLCEQGDVLYIDLENGERRMKARVETLYPNPARRPDLTHLDLLVGAPQIGDEFFAVLDQWYSRVERPRLVVIDVLQRVKPRGSASSNAYENDYAAIAPLQAWATKRGVAVVLLHHTRKGGADDPLEALSGSNGLSACADTTLLLDKKPDGTITLYVRGRDVEERETAMTFAGGHWTAAGAASTFKTTRERARILNALSESDEPLSPADIAGFTGMKSPNVRQLLHSMAKVGDVEKAGRGRYRLPPSH